jgi:hypothetical protein
MASVSHSLSLFLFWQFCGFKLGVLCLLGRCSTTWATSPALFPLVIFEIGSYFFAQGWVHLDLSSCLCFPTKLWWQVYATVLSRCLTETSQPETVILPNFTSVWVARFIVVSHVPNLSMSPTHGLCSVHFV